MTAFTSRIAPREASLRDLVAIWVVITLTLAYLEVPIANAPLFATALVLQAALGTVVILWLLPGAQASLLLTLGPGLILGGALSFAVFQIVGRGVVGVVTSLLLGGLALSRPVRSHGSSRLVASEPTLYLHMLGLAALGMASEFEWLLIAAVGFLLAGVSLGVRSTPTWKVGVLAIVALCSTLVVAVLFRGEWWWVVTDDYNFFEVLSRHLTLSGPLADWGSLEVTRYHWLSYGWSGLLDYTALNPGPLITLTRVMPFTYSVALGASLLMIAERVGNAQQVGGSVRHTLLVALPAWVLVANFHLDWSGTSTAGVFAVLASVVALLAIVVDEEETIQRRLVLYGASAVLLALTKLPSLLTLIALVVAVEVLRLTRHQSPAKRLSRTAVAVLLGGTATVGLLIPFSAYVQALNLEWDSASSATRDGGLLSESFRVWANSAWLILLVVVVWLVVLAREHGEVSASTLLMLCLGPLLLVALAMEVSIQGTEKANFHDYFSGPNYLLSLLTLLGIVPLLAARSPLGPTRRSASVWILAALATAALALIAEQLPLPARFESATLQSLISDERVLLSVAFLAWLVARKSARDRVRLPLIVVMGLFLAAGAASGITELVEDGFNPRLPSGELEMMLGATDSQKVGVWLANNTRPDDLLATNHLYDEIGTRTFGDDYSLAVWSHREFLVLGPKFFAVSETAAAEINLSLRFGENPTAGDAKNLTARGVAWFVVDTATTDRRSWEPYGETVLQSDRFWVVRLRETAA
jgi:hypothetical protein